MDERMSGAVENATIKYLPVYFLIDVSESMVGEPLAAIQEGLNRMNNHLKKEELVTDRVLISLIVFAGKVKRLFPLTGTDRFFSPAFTVGRGTSTGNALSFLMEELAVHFEKAVCEKKRYDRPLVFLLTDGFPTDATDSEFCRWNFFYRDCIELIAVSVGWNKIVSLLEPVTSSVFVLEQADPDGFEWLFKWIAGIIRKRCETSDRLQNCFPRLKRKYMVRATGKIPKNIWQENFLVFLGKCQITKSLYLIKYVRQEPVPAGTEVTDGEQFVLVGAYPVSRFYYELSAKGINRKIRTEKLNRFPVCPCCGNQYSFVICECGRAFCADEHAYNKCPWCGYRGMLVSTDQ